MGKKKVIIRVDGSSEIGLGHISRCCALAEMLKDNFDIFFYTRATSEAIINDIKKYCAEVFLLNKNISYEEEASQWISNLDEENIIVLDGYNFNTSYQQQIKNKGCKLVCIDDIHAYHFVADIVINHAPGITKRIYSSEPYTKFYLGTDYVLLKNFFLDEALKPQKTFNVHESPVLICLGGADPNNFTQQVLQEILHLFPSAKINVIVGAAYKHLSELYKLINTNNCIALHQIIQAKEMLMLMQQSHIAITSASTTALEYICVKGNLFLKCIADNQEDIYQSLIEKKCAYPFESLKENFHSNITIPYQHKLIDGRSNERLLKVFLALTTHLKLTISIASEEDVNTYFLWANDPEVRVQAYNTTSIQFNDHKNWFARKLNSENSKLYIFKFSNERIGQVRFDISKDRTALISYSIDKNFRGRGLAKKMLHTAIKKLIKESGITCFLAHVKSDNVPSIKVFENINFTIIDEVIDNNRKFYVYQYNLNENNSSI